MLDKIISDYIGNDVIYFNINNRERLKRLGSFMIDSDSDERE